MRKTEEFSEEDFLQKWTARFEMDCKVFIEFPTEDNYYEYVYPYILIAEKMFELRFIGEET